jgi:hypothetical protein
MRQGSADQRILSSYVCGHVFVLLRQISNYTRTCYCTSSNEPDHFIVALPAISQRFQILL